VGVVALAITAWSAGRGLVPVSEEAGLEVLTASARTFDPLYNEAVAGTRREVDLMRRACCEELSARLEDLDAEAYALKLNAERFRRHYDKKAWVQARSQMVMALVEAEIEICQHLPEQLEAGLRVLGHLSDYRDTLGLPAQASVQELSRCGQSAIVYSSKSAVSTAMATSSGPCDEPAPVVHEVPPGQ